MEQLILGEEAKFAVNVSAEGFSMTDDTFKVSIMRGHNVVKEYTKEDLVLDGDVWIMCVDTTETGTGSFDAAVTAYVPDSLFPDGLRTEIERVQLMNVKKL